MTTDSQTAGETGAKKGGAFELVIQARGTTGTSKARSYRKQGLIPAVAYELGKDSVSFLLDKRNFVQQASRALSSQVFILGDGVPELKGRKALIKEVQRDGIKGDVLHVDFLLLEEKRPAVVIVPVVVKGEAPGVKQQGGVLTVQCREVTVFAPPESIPSEIEVNVSALNLGDRIRTKDIKLPEGVVLKSSSAETVANVIAGRAAKLGEGEGEGGEAAAAGEKKAEGAAK
ncbi:MAG: 50S ribosomal protein L25 [Bdellovibrionales bacterium]|nr:50S ribosomal protein L25 [Bdellovibrionales bacterium]